MQVNLENIPQNKRSAGTFLQHSNIDTTITTMCINDMTSINVGRKLVAKYGITDMHPQYGSARYGWSKILCSARVD